MNNQTPLSKKQLRQLIGNVVTGIPYDLSNNDAKYWNSNTRMLHKVISEILKRNNDVILVKSGETICFIENLTLKVNYDKSVEELVNMGGYNSIDEEITSKNFPKSNNGKDILELLIVRFSRDMDSEEVLKEFDRMNLRPANNHELLNFGTQHSEIQKNKEFIQLGSLSPESEDPRITVICNFVSGERDLKQFRYYGNCWSDDMGHLAFRK